MGNLCGGGAAAGAQGTTGNLGGGGVQLNQGGDFPPSSLEESKLPSSSGLYVKITDRLISNIDAYYVPVRADREATETTWSDKASILGSGQFGTVWRVKNKQHGYICALKQIKKPRRGSSKREIDTLKNEVGLLMQVAYHPCIVDLYEVLETDSKLYLAQEICEGEELFYAIQNSGVFSEADAASVMSDILSALIFMHGKGIMHRDLKPENILLTVKKQHQGGNMCAVKLCDFGLACAFSENQRASRRAGTAYYIAPEVLNAGKRHGQTFEYDNACDLWSLGVILYILLCGYPPFAGDSDREIYSQIKAGLDAIPEGAFPAEDWQGISKEAMDLIRKMLVLKPEKRITASQAQKHVWVQSVGPGMSTALRADVMSKISTFSRSNRLKTVAKELIVSQLDQTEVGHLREAFEKMDLDKSGTISISELQQAMQALQGGTARRRESISGLLQNMDVDGDGEIDYKEFLMATAKSRQLYRRDLVRSAFDRLDTDHNGKLTKDEVLSALANEDTPESVVRDIMAEVDVDGDGMIDYSEFTAMMQKADEATSASDVNVSC